MNSVLLDDTTNRSGDLYIRSICFSPDGKFLATGAEDRQIRVSTPSLAFLPGPDKRVASPQVAKRLSFAIAGTRPRCRRISIPMNLNNDLRANARTKASKRKELIHRYGTLQRNVSATCSKGTCKKSTRSISRAMAGTSFPARATRVPDCGISRRVDVFTICRSRTLCRMSMGRLMRVSLRWRVRFFSTWCVQEGGLAAVLRMRMMGEEEADGCSEP